MIVELDALHQQVESFPRLEFVIPASVLANTEIISRVDSDSRLAEEVFTTDEVPTTLEITEMLSEKPSQEELLQENVLTVAQKEESNLQQNYSTIAERVSGAASLLGMVTSLIKIAGAACPHCAVAVASSIGSPFSIGALGGHWHQDGTFHRGDHGDKKDDFKVESEMRFNPFEWLKVAA